MSPVSAGAELLAAALDRFLVFGIFTNLAIIKDKSCQDVFIAACQLHVFKKLVK